LQELWEEPDAQVPPVLSVQTQDLLDPLVYQDLPVLKEQSWHSEQQDLKEFPDLRDSPEQPDPVGLRESRGIKVRLDL
jgi:hypothetical protein